MQVLQRGSSGPNVKLLKHYLNFLIDPSPHLTEADPRYDGKTELVVATLKQTAGLGADGKVDAQTWGIIGYLFGTKLPPNLPEKTTGRCFINNDLTTIPKWLRNLGLQAVNGPLDFDQSIFLNAYMETWGPTNESATRGLNQILKFIDLDPAVLNVQWAAYMMATIKHECANTWLPIEEFGKGSDQEYGSIVSVKGLDGEIYRVSFYGRGYVQLTWQKNYERLSRALNLKDLLLTHPDKALDADIAYKVLSLWMNGGYSANGRCIRDYTLDKKADYVGARHLVNGSDQADRIAKYATQLEAMLRASLR